MVIFESIRRWLGHRGMRGSHWSELQQWADDRQFEMRRARGQDGFVIEGRQGHLPWRMEWGPSQRDYIEGFELRMRAQAGLAPELQAVLMNVRLQDRLERLAFDPSGLEKHNARSDIQTPPEVRWLVTYDPVGSSELRALHGRWAGVSNVRPWLARWLAGPVAAELEALECHPDLPVLVMFARGRCTLRVALNHPHIGAIEPWLRLFESCLREAQRTGSAGCMGDDHPATQPGMFIPSPTPEREHLILS